MTDYTNNYFRTMNDIGKGYEAARAQRRLEKGRLMEANDWEGVKRWNEREEKEFPYPFSRGQMSAFRAWQNTNTHKSSVDEESVLEVNDLPWDGGAHDFIQTIKQAGIRYFAITDRGTALMEMLHVFKDEEGCKLIGLCKVDRIEERWGGIEVEACNGILMET